VWCCSRDPTFSHFSRTPTCDRQTDRQTTTAYNALAWRRAVKRSQKSKLETKDVLPHINNTQAAAGAEKCRFVPGDLHLWPLTLTFKLVYEFGANPFNGSRDISYTTKKPQTDGAKNRTFRSSLRAVKSKRLAGTSRNSPRMNRMSCCLTIWLELVDFRRNYAREQHVFLFEHTVALTVNFIITCIKQRRSQNFFFLGGGINFYCTILQSYTSSLTSSAVII